MLLFGNNWEVSRMSGSESEMQSAAESGSGEPFAPELDPILWMFGASL